MEKLTSMATSANPFVVPPLIANLAEVPKEFSSYSANLATSDLDQITKTFIAKNKTAEQFSAIVDNLLTASLTVTKSISINLHPQGKIRSQGWTNNKV